jgi:hypothetical protein
MNKLRFILKNVVWSAIFAVILAILAIFVAILAPGATNLVISLASAAIVASILAQRSE